MTSSSWLRMMRAAYAVETAANVIAGRSRCAHDGNLLDDMPEIGRYGNPHSLNLMPKMICSSMPSQNTGTATRTDVREGHKHDPRTSIA